MFGRILICCVRFFYAQCVVMFCDITTMCGNVLFCDRVIQLNKCHIGSERGLADPNYTHEAMTPRISVPGYPWCWGPCVDEAQYWYKGTSNWQSSPEVTNPIYYMWPMATSADMTRTPGKNRNFFWL